MFLYKKKKFTGLSGKCADVGVFLAPLDRLAVRLGGRHSTVMGAGAWRVSNSGPTDSDSNSLAVAPHRHPSCSSHMKGNNVFLVLLAQGKNTSFKFLFSCNGLSDVFIQETFAGTYHIPCVQGL